MGAQIATVFALRALRVASERGIDVEPIARAARLSGAVEETRPISEARHLQVWERLMKAGRDPALPVFYAERVSIDDYGLLGLASKTAARLGDALALVSSQLAAYTDALEIGLERGRSTSRVVLRRAGPLTLGRRVSTESTLAELVGAFRTLTGVHVLPLGVAFRHARFSALSHHTRFFGVTPSFDAEADAVEVANADLELPLLRSDRALFSYLKAELERLAAAARERRRKESYADQAGDALTRQFPRPPRVAAVAQAIGLSARSLQRHLEREGTSFAGVTASVRRELAEAMLADGTYSLGEVADALGFIDPASLSRALRRWRGAKHRGPRSGR